MTKKHFFLPLVAFGLLTTLSSCLDNDDDGYSAQLPTALVTVCPEPDGSFFMVLDDKTLLYPTNLTKSPFDDKEVRALVNFSDVETSGQDAVARRDVKVNWIDSIRTKLPVETLGAADIEKYGNDPLEIVQDWVTIAEDGYLTLRVRTVWGNRGAKHALNLVSGTNPENPYEFVLRHNAEGDVIGEQGDALIAFNLNRLPGMTSEPVKIKVKWNSFYGEKSAEFDLKKRSDYSSSAKGIDTGKLLPAMLVD